MRWSARASGERTGTRRRRSVLVAAGLACWLAAAPLSAQPKDPGTKVAAAAKIPAKPAPPKKLDLDLLATQLSSPGTIAAGLAAVESAGTKAKTLAPRVEEILAKGLTADLAIAAMGALGAIGSPTSSAVIAPYVQHRNPDLRKAAVLALTRTRGPGAAIALRKGLRSSDAAVRTLSATGLEVAGDKESVPDLVRALDRGILEAAPSIGAQCSGAQCDDLLARLDKLPLDKQKAVLEAMLRRKPALSDDVLLTAIAKVEHAAGTSAKAYFSPLAKSYKGSRRAQRALDAAAHPPKDGKP